jgi:hypothetical protein
MSSVTEHKFDWVLSVFKKISFFLVLAACILAFFYILGNFENFLDSTQTMLLSFLEIDSLLGFIIELYCLIALFTIAVREKKMQLARFVLTLVLLVFFLGIYILIKFLATWL